MNVEDVHKRINDLAEERGLSPYELARRAGMAQSSLYNMFERGTMPNFKAASGRISDEKRCRTDRGKS